MKMNTERRRNPQPWGDGEIDSIYVEPSDRFVVSLIVSYGPNDDVLTMEKAAHWALELTRDAGASGTSWFVYDRETGEGRFFEQGDIE